MSKEMIKEIGKLSVIELAQLIKDLEAEFGVSAAAPVAMAAAPSAAAAPAAAAEKNEYKVVLKDSGSDKIKVIKALRAVTTLALKEAKDLVEGEPATVAESAPKEEAAKMKQALEEAGAKVELV
ncbi:MAG: large subunit ribosomal protein [Candidatus Dependentiae bacterium]|nr:large subunit ribosomal protein [Candidatus Dependentiae bacterium]